MVGHREARKEGRYKEVLVLPPFPPDEQGEDDECYEEGIQGVDLGDYCLRPEKPARPESKCSYRRGHNPPAECEPNEEHRDHPEGAEDCRGKVHPVGNVPDRKVSK